MGQIYKKAAFILILAAFLSGGSLSAYAAEDHEVSGWIPYWKIEAGTKDAKKHINDLDTIHPFGYTVNADGSLNDTAKISGKAWQDLFEEAEDEGVEIIPSITWTDGEQIDKILGSRKSRTKHVKEVARLVKKKKFDGINIDYEAKLAKTKDDFSLFLKELKKELSSKRKLACAIEARTPPESLYRVVPGNIQYANDYAKIGKYCDVVQVMAYDQGRADFRLNDQKSGTPYIPVADADWVRKVAEHTIKDIPKNKIVLGVPTYGYEYEVTVSPNWFKDYRKIRSVNQPQALATSEAFEVTPSRNKAGEMSYSYATTYAPLIAAMPVPANTPGGDIVAQKALAYANLTGQTITFNQVVWSDAEAIEDKVDIVEDLGLKGVAIFKIDGEEDKKVWRVVD
jgi:spore germination protein YaaH